MVFRVREQGSILGQATSRSTKGCQNSCKGNGNFECHISDSNRTVVRIWGWVDDSSEIRTLFEFLKYVRENGRFLIK